MSRQTLPLAALVLSTACVSLDSDVALPASVRERVALCGGGLAASLGLDVRATVGRSLQEGGALSATLRRKLEGAFLEKIDPANAEARQLIQAYLTCIQSQVAR